MDLKYWQEKIRDKRKQTNFRDFVREIACWYPIVLNKKDGSLSRYPETNRSPLTVSIKEFSKNIDSNLNYWINYNFSINFFENFKKLFLRVPISWVHDFDWTSENSDYADIVSSSKNVYLSWNVTVWNENVLYSLWVKEYSKDVLNSIMVWDNSSIVFNSHSVISSFKIFYSKYVYDSNNIYFSTNMQWCSECIFCDNLINKSYCISNREYKKEEYFELKEKTLKEKNKFALYFSKLNNIWKNIWSNNVDWIFAIKSENIDKWIYLYNVINWRNIILAWYSYWIENLYDSIFNWAKSDCYWTLCVWKKAENVYCSFWISGWTNLFYCYDLVWGCSYCLGCIWLKNKSYCILNKQYEKEEWKLIVSEIFKHMESDWILWDYFPPKLNPFYFNNTLAWIIGNFKKEDVEEKWYMWRDKEIKVDIPEGSEIIRISDLKNYQWFNKDWKWQINPDIMKKVIVDNKWNYYKIVKMEYDFLMKYGLPLPENHWMDRVKMNFGI